MFAIDFGRYSASIMAVVYSKERILFFSCRILFHSVVGVRVREVLNSDDKMFEAQDAFRSWCFIK